jgi:SAM-dependent methyltransferase
MSSGGADHWFEALADHLGRAYLRYSFTRGTANEVAFLVEVLGLEPGQRVLDVGCGPGRHARALAERGIEVLGVDISERFVELARLDAPPGARFERLDARRLSFDAEFDAVISLCQGAFGLAGAVEGPAGAVEGPAGAVEGPAGVVEGPAGAVEGPAGAVEACDEATSDAEDPDGTILAGMARALRPGARLAVSAFSAYFQVRYLEPDDTFYADAGVNLERSVLRDEAGTEASYDLWTSCFTPRELRLLARSAGLHVQHLWSVTPGRYARNPPELDQPELLLIARR